MLRGKESPMKANRTRLAVLVVVVGVTLFFTGALASADDGPGKQALSGVWQVEVTRLSDCGATGVPVVQLAVLDMYTSDGKVIENPSGGPVFPGILRPGPGLGSWQHEGGQQFTAVFRGFLITVPANLPAGSTF